MESNILILDRDDEILKKFSAARINTLRISLYQDTAEFIRNVQDSRRSIQCCLVASSQVPSVRMTLQDLGTRFLVICEDAEELSSLDLPSVKRSASYLELESAVYGLIDSLRLKAEVPEANPLEFIQIRADQFLSGSQALFDVYVKLSEKKMVKILHAGDAFKPERLSAYMARGVSSFYIPRKSHEAYLRFSEKLATAALKAQSIGPEVRSALILKQGEDILRHLSAFGCDRDLIGYGRNFVENLNKMVKLISDRTDHKTIKKLLGDVHALEHAVAVSTIAGIFAKVFGICSEEPLKTVGLASLFHDLALVEEGIREEDLQQKSQDRFWNINYQSHPDDSATILEDIGGIQPIVTQAIRQHHMRTRGRGFPSRPAGTVTHKLAEVLGLADEFANLLKKHEGKLEEVKLELEESIFPFFTPTSVLNFRQAFFGIKDKDVTRL